MLLISVEGVPLVHWPLLAFHTALHAEPFHVACLMVVCRSET